jgi:hypothetical protein
LVGVNEVSANLTDTIEPSKPSLNAGKTAMRWQAQLSRSFGPAGRCRSGWNVNTSGLNVYTPEMYDVADEKLTALESRVRAKLLPIKRDG